MTELEKNLIDNYALSESQAKALAPDILKEIKDAFEAGYARCRSVYSDNPKHKSAPDRSKYLKEKGYE